jgi:hypothetical protein
VEPTKNPWWQATKTPKQGFIIGGAWAAIAVLQWVLLVADTDQTPRVLLRVGVASMATLLAAFSLTSAVLLRLRQKARKQASDG